MDETGVFSYASYFCTLFTGSYYRDFTTHSICTIIFRSSLCSDQPASPSHCASTDFLNIVGGRLLLALVLPLLSDGSFCEYTAIAATFKQSVNPTIRLHHLPKDPVGYLSSLAYDSQTALLTFATFPALWGIMFISRPFADGKRIGVASLPAYLPRSLTFKTQIFIENFYLNYTNAFAFFVSRSEAISFNTVMTFFFITGSLLLPLT